MKKQSTDIYDLFKTIVMALQLCFLVYVVVLSNVVIASEPPPVDGLIAYYPFNGNCNDESGNGYHLTNAGAVPTPDRYGNVKSSYYFNGLSSYLVSPYEADSKLFPSGSFSISVWFRTSNTNRVLQDIVSTHEHTVHYGYFFYVDNFFNDRAVVFYTAAAGHLVSTSYPVTDGRWHHAVGIWDAGVQSLYLDGKLEATVTAPAGDVPYNPAIPFSVGRGYGGETNYMLGAIDDLRIYDRALTSTEIASLYANQISVYTGFAAQGETGSIAIRTRSGQPWKAVSDVAWIKILSGAAGRGSGEVTYQVLPNTKAVERKGEIQIGGEIYPILQKGAQQ